MEENVSVIARGTGVLQIALLTVIPHGGQRTARRNAFAAATAARNGLSERAEAFAALDRAAKEPLRPAAS